MNTQYRLTHHVVDSETLDVLDREGVQVKMQGRRMGGGVCLTAVNRCADRRCLLKRHPL